MFDPTPRFLLDVFAKRDFGLALENNWHEGFNDEEHQALCDLLSNLLAPVGAQLGSAGAHDVVGRRDICLFSASH